ncbi:Cryparin [Hyphodiscus hymeniophilus]|uniref:Cryparin n=1 Tax=Hyphodiscus hymeniophilus TaxID=353542 RepID=A0A9P6VLW6_9HELO|nr:Cryparin [Hyphodiscus hymeniophilus]
MRTSFITLTGLVAVAMAMPANLVQRQVFTCGSGSLECCDVDVLGIADLDCESPPSTPTDLADFVSICAAVGKIDMCCDLPILGQGLICTSPSGGGTGA